MLLLSSEQSLLYLPSCVSFEMSLLNRSCWTQTFTEDLPVSVSNGGGLEAFATLSTAEAAFMPRLKGESREVLGTQRWPCQLHFVQQREQHVELLIPFLHRDTSLPHTPSSGILDKRPLLRLSGQTLRRWGYLLDGEELVCVENRREQEKAVSET